MDTDTMLGIRVTREYSLDIKDDADIRSWTVTLHHLDEDLDYAHGPAIGRADVLQLRRSDAAYSAASCDAHSGDVAHYMPLFDEHGPLADDVDDKWMSRTGFGDGLVIVDRLTIEPTERGHGYGALLLTEAIEELAHGYELVAIYPSAIEHPSPDGPGLSAEGEAMTARLARHWDRFGFEPYADGVHIAFTAERALTDGRRLAHKLAGAR